MTAYYNEIDPFAAQWLRNLISAGLIAPGDVDEGSIEDVRPDDLAGYTQCHFFAGIGVWSYALRNAGWPDDREVWTGSCPCPPFSAAGKGSECPSCGGKSCLSHPVVTAGWICLDCGDEWRGDDRHLLPEFIRLKGQCRPAVVFGEQVASRDGRLWLYTLRAVMEEAAYAVGAADMCAAGVGAPHIRQRLWFVEERLADGVRPGRAERWAGAGLGSLASSSTRRLDDDDDARLEGHGGGHRTEAGHREGPVRPASAAGESGGLAGFDGRPGPTNGFWRDADWLFCRDGKWRPVEPGSFPLANRTPGRVGQLRAYGNAIVAQAAEAFIRAYLASQAERLRLTDVSVSTVEDDVFS